MLQPEAEAIQNKTGDTALNLAAMVGNTKAAVILVKKNPGLVYIRNNQGSYPVHRAAVNAHRDILLYLLTVTIDNVEPSPFENQSGARLLVNIIVSAFLDVALDLVQRYPDLATLKLKNGDSPLKAIARKASAFPSGSCLKFWQRSISSCVPVNLERYVSNPKGSDVENPANSSQMSPNIQSGFLASYSVPKVTTHVLENW